MDGTVGDHGGSSAAVRPLGASQGCRHAAAVVDTLDGLRAVGLPFLAEGLRAGDLTVLTCRPETAELLCRELGPSSARLEHDLGLSLLGARPPDVFTHLRRHVERALQDGSGRVRVLAEALVAPTPDGWREEMRLEAAFNQVAAGLPVTAMCLYETGRIPADVVASVGHTHPVVATPDGWRDSGGFQDAPDFVRRLPRPRESVEDGPPVFAADDVRSLPELRHRLGVALEPHVPGAELREDLHLALSEVAANAFRHGVPPVSARMWADGDRIVCTITDRGRSFDDPLAGFVPARGWDLSRGGMGLWLARKLWDHVDLFLGPQGFTVRLSTSLHP